MDIEIQKNERKTKLIRASKRVRKESMLVNAEFSQVEYAHKYSFRTQDHPREGALVST